MLIVLLNTTGSPSDVKPFTSELSFRIQNQTSVICESTDSKHMFTIRPRFFFDVYLPYLINGRIKDIYL